MFKVGDRLIFTRPDGTQEECEMAHRGCVPGCIVVYFFTKDGRYTNHDGLTLPLNKLRKKA